MQSENKNDGVQLSTRYQQYCFAKQHLRGTPRPKVFPFGENDNPLTKKNGHQVSESAISGTLTATDAKMHLDGTYINQLNNPTHSNDRVYGTDGLSPTLNTMQGGMRQPFIQQRSRGKNKGGSHAVAPTMTGATHKDNNHVNAIRRLTPVECERLQGFPDNWTASVSDTQRYKCCGNAVTVNVVRDIMSKLLTWKKSPPQE